MVPKLLAAASRLTLVAALALQPVATAHAQSVAIDRTAGTGTGLDVTPQGVPIVNIATPNGAGLSHNIYTTFGAGREGLILNNSADNVDTALGGSILGNPNLAGQRAPASLILNEVTGGTRSQLMGAIEVAGRGADVVVANPFGITCDGCGFVNAPRVVLSTGRPELGADGGLVGLRVEGGDVLVTGGGLLAGNVDHFDIVAGAARINADLFARDLTVAGGAGNYDLASRTASGGSGSGVVIDAAALGGMYANRIRLIGTGAGVGINLQGTVAAQAGDLEITTTGEVALRSAHAKGSLRVDADTFHVTRQAYAAGSLDLDVRTVDIAGALVAAGGDLTVAARETASLTDASIYAGLGADGRIGAAGDLRLSGGAFDLLRTDLVAGNGLTVTAASLRVDAASDASGSEVVLSLGALDNAGTLSSDRALDVRVADFLNRAGGALYAGADARLDLDAGTNEGSLLAAGDLALTARGDFLAAGRLTGDRALSLAAGANLRLTGAVEAGGALALTAGRDLRVAGTALTNAALSADAGDRLDVSGALNADGIVTIRAGTFGNGGEVAGAGVSIAATGSGRNDGSISAGTSGVSVAAAGDFVSGGTISTTGAAALSAGAIDLSGRLTANGGVDLRAAGALALGGELMTLGSAALTAGGDMHVGGALRSEGSLVLTAAGSIDNRGELRATGALAAVAGGRLTTSGAITAGDLTIRARDAAVAGATASGGRMSLTVDGGLDVSGRLEAAGSLDLSGASLALGNGSQLLGGAAVSLTAAQTLTSAGRVESGGPLAASSGGALAVTGTVRSHGSTMLTGASVTTGGSLASVGDVTVTGGGVALGGTTETAGRLSTSAVSGTLTGAGMHRADAGMTFIGATSVDLTAGSFETGGALAVATTADLRIGASMMAAGGARFGAGGALTSDGALAAGGDLQLAGATISVLGGLSAGGAMALRAHSGAAALGAGALLETGGVTTIDAAGTLRNAGEVRSRGDLLVNAGTVNSGGLLASDGAVAVTAADRILIAGTVTARRSLSLDGDAIDVGGTLRSQGDIAATAGDQLALGGTLAAGGAATLQATTGDLLLRSTADIGAADSVALVAGGAIDQAGDLVAGRGLTLAAGSDVTLRGAVGTDIGLAITAGGALDLLGHASALHDMSIATGGAFNVGTGGSLEGGRSISLNVATSVVNAGRLETGGAITILAASLANSGEIAANGAAALTVGGHLSSMGLLSAGTGLVAASGSLALGGRVASGGALDLSASGALGLSGRLEARGAATIRSSGGAIDVSASGELLAGRGASFAAASITSAGLVEAGGDLAFTATGSIGNSGSLLAGGAAALTAGTALASSGRLAATGAIDLRGASVALGPVTSQGGLTATSASGDLTLTGAVQAAGIRLAAAGNATSSLIGTLASTGAVDIDAGASLSLAGAVAANGAITLDAAGALATTGGLQGGDGIGLTAGGAITTGGNVTALSDLSLTGSALSLGGSLATNGTLVARALAGGAGIDGTLAAVGALSITTDAGSIAIGGSGGAQSSRAVRLTAARDLSNAGTIDAGEGAQLRAVGDLTNAGALRVTGDALLQAGAALRQTGTVQATGNLALTGRSVLAGGTAANGATTLTATGGDLTVTATVSSVGSVSASATGLASVAAGGRLVGQTASLQGTTGVSVSGLVSGAAGATLTTGGSMTLAAGSRVETNGNVTLTAASGALQANGEVAAAGTASATARSLAVGGTVAAQNVGLTATAGDLSVAGSVSGTSGVTLAAAGALGVGGAGRVLSEGAIGLSAGTDLGAGGRVDAGGSLTATAGRALTNHGVLIAAGDIGLTAGTTLRTTNRIDGLQRVTLSGTALDLGGTVRANGTLAMSAGAGGATLSGQLSSLGDVTLSSAAGVTLSGGSVTAGNLLGLSAASLDNGGTLQSGGRLTASVAGNAMNRGSLLSGTRIAVTAGGSISNSGRIEVTAGSAAVQGLDNAATANIALDAGGTVTNSGNIYSDGSVSIVSRGGNIDGSGQGYGQRGMSASAASGTIVDLGRLSSGAGLSLTLGTGLVNTRGLTAAGDLRLTAASLSNQALLGAGGNLTLNIGGAVDNASTIFAGGDLALGAASLSNTGTVLAQGNMLVRGSGLAGAIATLDNASGTIQSLGGSIDIAAGTLRNFIRDYAEAVDYGDGSDAAYYREYVTVNSGAATISAAGNVTISATGTVNDKSNILAGGNLSISGDYLHNLGRQLRFTRTEITYVEEFRCLHAAADGGCYEPAYVTVERPTVVTSYDDSNRARIQAGGAVSINVREFVNDGYGGSTGAPARGSESTPGGSGGAQVGRSGAGGADGTSLAATGGGVASGRGTAAGAVGPSARSTSLVVGGDGISRTAQLGGRAAAAANGGRGGASVDAQAPISAGGYVAGSLDLGAGGPGGHGLAPIAIDGASGPTALGAIKVPAGLGLDAAGASLQRLLGNGGLAGPGGLYAADRRPDARVLFRTDPGFASTAALYDSDYFFDRVGLDRETYFVRLGDGFFEAQAVAAQVQQLSGRAQLDGFADAAAQFHGLIGSALAQAQALQLTPGVALTADQVANLKSSLVWWVSMAVEGREVLVPVVYLAQVDQDDLQGGAIVGGGSVQIATAGDLANRGTIAADRVLRLDSSGSIENADGARLIGGATVLTAAADVVNRAGGAIAGGNLVVQAGRDVRLEGGSRVDLTGSATLLAGRDLTLASAATAAADTSRTDFGKRRFSEIASSSTTQTGTSLNVGGDLHAQAGRDLSVTGSSVKAGGDASLLAGGNVTVASAEESASSSSAFRLGKKSYGEASANSVTNKGSSIEAGGDLRVSAGGALSVLGSTLAAGGDLALAGAGGVTIAAVEDSSQSASSGRQGGRKSTESHSRTTNLLSTLAAGGDLTVSTPGALEIKGADVAAGGTARLAGGTVEVTGVVDTTSSDVLTSTKKSGLVSSKKTTTHTVATDQEVVGSTVVGDRVVVASAGDTTIRGSTLASANGTAIIAGGNVDIGTMTEADSYDQSTQVKKSGVSVSGGGLFAGVAKNSTDGTSDTITSVGSVIASANGGVTIDAGKALELNGSAVMAPGAVTLAGESVTIAAATDTADGTLKTKSSSFGLSIKAYENVSGAVNSVASLPDRVANGASGGAAQGAVTAASETLRTVGSVLNAVTNAAGVTASVGVSKSSSNSTTHETTAIGSTVMGGDVAIAARAGDLTVIGSNISGDNSVMLAAAHDVLLKSARNSYEETSSSKSSGASLGVTVGVSLIGAPHASASANVGASRSSGYASGVTQVNTQVTSGGGLAIASGRDTALSGAMAQGHDVSVLAGRNLTVESLQDTAESKSKSAGVSLGVSYSISGRDSPWGANGSLSAGKGTSNSAVVIERSAILAKGGSLDVSVGGATTLTGGILAALDAQGEDSGKLALETDTLTVTDIKDSAKSKDVSAGVSASVNDPFEKGVEGANLPVVEGAYASSVFKQDTKGTIGKGDVAIRDAANSTDLASVNRDVAAAQVVTKDKTSGFTVYADPAAAKELGAILTNPENSVIAQGVAAVAKDPLGPANALIAEAKTLVDGVADNGALGALVAQIVAGLTPDERYSVNKTTQLLSLAIDQVARSHPEFSPTEVTEAAKALAADPEYVKIAAIQKQFNDLGGAVDRDLIQARIAAYEREAVAAKTPEAQVAAEEALRSEMAAIVVVGRPDGEAAKLNAFLDSVVAGVEYVGRKYSDASPVTQALIQGTLTVAGGVKNAVTSLAVSAVPGIGEMLAKASETAVIATDAVARRESFGEVKADYEQGDTSTLHQYAGTELVFAAVALGTAAAKAAHANRGMGATSADGYAAKYIFDAKAGRYRSAETGEFIAARNLPWPDSAGFSSSSSQTVQAGTLLDRYGAKDGRFLGEPGASVSERGMPLGSEELPYSRYLVVKPFDARVGPAAPVPDFGAQGGATQYLPGPTVQQLLDSGYIVEIK